MRRIARGFAFLSFAWFALPGSRSAHAGSDEAAPATEAEAHVARGLELRRQRRDEEALIEFRAAYAAEKSGRALAQMALAEDAVGLWVEAEESFETVLAGTGDAWVEKRRDALGEELRVVRMHLADLALDVVPSNAQVWINGALAERKTKTGAFRIISGRILVEVKANGFETARRVLEVSPETRSHETIALAETAPPPPNEKMPLDRVLPAPPPPMSTPRIFALSAFGVAAAGVVVGTVGGVGRALTLSEYNDPTRCGSARSVQCPGVRNDFDNFTTAMIAGYAAAGVAALTGGVLFFAFPGKARIAITPQGTSGFLGVAEGRF